MISHIISGLSYKTIFGSIGMIYAMLSIGVLGFIVWSQWMALLSREIKVINFTICWKGLTLLDTFYSSNANNFTQSAGNFNKGSSETIRENSLNNFYLFLTSYKHFYFNNFKENESWLRWFVGFSEGDGAILENKGRLRFVLTQKDKNILYHIQNVLNFGKVKEFENYSRFIVENNKDILLLYLLFNGNLALTYRINQLNRWIKFLPKLNIEENFGINNIPLVNKINFLPTLNDSWLSGFTDAEGCFSISISPYYNKNKNIKEDKYYVKSRFILDQKDGDFILSDIALLLNSTTKPKKRNKTNNVIRLNISCNDYESQNSKIIFDYFNRFLLKTTKVEGFKIWCNVTNMIQGNQPLSLVNIKIIRELRSQINKYLAENNPLGSAKYS
jgi:LAGLIDADG endonuclease